MNSYIREYVEDTFTPTVLWNIFILSSIVTFIIYIVVQSTHLDSLEKNQKIIFDRLTVLEKQSAQDHELIGEMWSVVIQIADKLNGAVVARVSKEDYSEMEKAYMIE